MNKRELKSRVKDIKNTIRESEKVLSTDFSDELYKIESAIDNLESTIDEVGVCIDIDFEQVKGDIVRNLIESKEINQFHVDLEELITEVEEWRDDSSDNKADEIQDNYIDGLETARDSFEIDSIECIEDLESQLSEVYDALENLPL